LSSKIISYDDQSPETTREVVKLPYPVDLITISPEEDDIGLWTNIEDEDYVIALLERAKVRVVLQGLDVADMTEANIVRHMGIALIEGSDV
jgi:hypothetical protein